MANFAKAQLLKYGWTEGKGLGKNENGITEALKPKLKFNTEGLGHKLEEIQWWESAFNNAVKNVSISSENDEVSISVTNTNNMSSSITTEENLKENRLIQEQYNNFRKTSMLQDEKLIMLKNAEEKEEEKPGNKIPLLTDDELFKACGGRTAHKGARHGLSLNGKLERIARQEKKLLGLMSNLSNKEIVNNSTSKSESTVEIKDVVDNNANAILTKTNLSCNEEDGFVKSKSTLKKEKRKIRNLSHLLSSSCNIEENSSSSMVALNGKKSSLKRKRSKDGKTSVNTEITDGNILSTVTLEDRDISFFTNSVFEKKNKKQKKHKKSNPAKEDSNTSLYDRKRLHHDSRSNISLKLKKKRTKSQENDDISTEAVDGSKMKEFKYQRKRIVKLMEKMNFGSNSEDERVKNEEKNSIVDVIKSESTFSSDKILRYNQRISKAKSRRNKKNKTKANLERSTSTVVVQRKSGSAMESLMSVDITDDVSAKLKESKNMRNKKIEGKDKNGTDCNTDI